MGIGISLPYRHAAVCRFETSAITNAPGVPSTITVRAIVRR